MKSPTSATDEVVTELQTLINRMNDEVPPKARNMLKEIERLDRETVRLGEAFFSKQINYMANCQKLSSEQKLTAFTQLQKDMSDVTDLSDKKLGLIGEAKKIIADFHEKFREYESKFIENIASPSKNDSTNQDENEEEEEEDEEEPEEEVRGRRKKKVAKKEKREYCWCQLTKDDEMVACENPSCKYEWFHFKCIGMKDVPSGDWYCSSDCRAVVEAKQKEEKKKGTEAKKTVGRKRKRN